MQVSSKRVSRAQCSNCTCSPGLLSRTSKRSSWFAKQINLNRSLSGNTSPRTGSRKGSVFTLDASSLCLPETKEINTSLRLEKLRGAMKKYDLGVYIIPSEDLHQSEYTSPLDQRRSFISGFLGSAGVAIVTRDVASMNETPEGLAALSTDGRYFNQAANELDFNWVLLRQGVKGEPSWDEWAIDQAIQLSLDSGAEVKIGVDPRLINHLVYEKITSTIKSKLAASGKGAAVALSAVKENLVDLIWADFEELPVLAGNPIKYLDTKFTGESIESKINKLIDFIKKSGNGNALVISALDEIAWTLNLRGSDIEYNPVFYAYLIITDDRNITLFADSKRFHENVLAILAENKVTVKPYESFSTSLMQLSEKFGLENKKVLINSLSATWEIVRILEKCFVTIPRNPVEDFKSIKNDVELKGAKIAHLKDGRALIRFFAWLENELINNNEMIDEITADDKLTAFRQEEENFVGLSFATISATAANGAVIHYKPTKAQQSVINPNKIYLNDSGSQFLEGTTDTTRTVHFGEPTADEIRNYTLVLKGNIGLGQLKFPENTTGNLIDSIARQYLWAYGLDYAHGTSHGIGAYLNVHEGPIGIGPRPNAAKSVLKPGHLISNEPGYYEDGEYGIRIENVMYVKESGLSYNSRNFYEFETVTRVPFCRKLIDKHLLNAEEKKWINEYHTTIWSEISDSLDKNSYEYQWLKRETATL